MRKKVKSKVKKIIIFIMRGFIISLNILIMASIFTCISCSDKNVNYSKLGLQSSVGKDSIYSLPDDTSLIPVPILEEKIPSKERKVIDSLVVPNKNYGKFSYKTEIKSKKNSVSVQYLFYTDSNYVVVNKLSENRIVKYPINTFTVSLDGLTDNYTVKDPSTSSVYKFSFSKDKVITDYFVFTNVATVVQTPKVVENPKTLETRKLCHCVQWSRKDVTPEISVFLVAKAYKVTIQQILEANPDGLKVGQKACIKRECATSTWR